MNKSKAEGAEQKIYHSGNDTVRTFLVNQTSEKSVQFPQITKKYVQIHASFTHKGVDLLEKTK